MQMRLPKHFQIVSPAFVKRRHPAQIPHGFSLIELIVVVALIVGVFAFVGPSLLGLKSAGDLSRSVYDVAGILEEARAYASSNNTFVYVCFQEADVDAPSDGKQNDGVGRINLVVYASMDGTRGYDVNDTSSWANNYANGRNFSIIDKRQYFENLHLVNLGMRPSSGGMCRPPFGSTEAIDPAYNLATCTSVTTFNYPLGSTDSSTLIAFTKVIQFDPQGVARIQQAANSDNIPKYIEIGFQQTHGHVCAPLTAPVSSGKVAALQIGGMSGSTHIYRP